MRDTERFMLVDELFREALRVPSAQREAFVRARCGSDDSVRREVADLLAEDDRQSGALDAPPDEAARLSGLGGPGGAPREPVPERIGPYRIIAILGEGGMGVVYEAEQESPRRKVALKVIAQELASPAVLRRFEHESQLLARLQHPGIAQVFQAGTHPTPRGPRPFFAMELIRGEPLPQYARSRSLGVRAILELVARICDAVHHAHQRGVIHRDLKPANILVDQTGQPKILDFGVARAIDSDIHATSRTDIGQLVGTVAYMSPEQAGGNPDDLDTRTDVYALGVIAYELLAGRLPHDVRGRSLADAVRLVCEAEPAPLGSVHRTLRGDVQTIVGKALEKDKHRRYDSASALGDDIRRLLTDQAIAARPRSATYQLGKFARRHRSLVAAAALAVVALGAAAIVSTWQAVRAERARAQAVERFDRLRELSRSLIFEVHDAIAPLPGSTKARQMVVSKGLDYLNGLASDAGDDPELLAEIAEGFARVADLQGNPRRANLGQIPEAIESSSRGRMLMDRALAAAASQEQRSSLLPRQARLLIGAAEVCSYTGRVDEGMVMLDQAAALVRPLAPEMTAAATALSNVVWLQGSLLRQNGKLEQALSKYQEAYALDESLLERAENRGIARRNLSSSASEIGSALLAMDKPAEAMDWFQRCLDARVELLTESPRDPRARRDVAIANQRLGAARLELDDAQGAVRHYAASVQITRELMKEDPENARNTRDLTVMLQRLGDATLRAGRTGEAIELYRESLDIALELQRTIPNDLDHAKAVGFSHEKLGDGLLAVGRVNEAYEQFKSALAAARGVVDRDERDRLAMTMLVVINRKLGELWLGPTPPSAPGASGSATADAVSEAADRFRDALEALAQLTRAGMTPASASADRGELEELLRAATDRGEKQRLAGQSAVSASFSHPHHYQSQAGPRRLCRQPIVPKRRSSSVRAGRQGSGGNAR